MIQVTEKASQQIAHLIGEEGLNPAKAMLRVLVKKGGCSGWSYKMDFDTEAKEGDKIFESHQTKVIVDSQSLLYLLGMTLDFEGGLNGQGFVFVNPNATKTCGCGASFGV